MIVYEDKTITIEIEKLVHAPHEFAFNQMKWIRVMDTKGLVSLKYPGRSTELQA